MKATVLVIDQGRKQHQAGVRHVGDGMVGSLERRFIVADALFLFVIIASFRQESSAVAHILLLLRNEKGRNLCSGLSVVRIDWL
ncbi:MAG: hypothetical protein LCH46_04870 [Proteobacteria bacterium]|nr:hypothetical protein [Pseudomonadota bacterium]